MISYKKYSHEKPCLHRETLSPKKNKKAEALVSNGAILLIGQGLMGRAFSQHA